LKAACLIQYGQMEEWYVSHIRNPSECSDRTPQAHIVCLVDDKLACLCAET
jgi:hypothetical protein